MLRHYWNVLEAAGTDRRTATPEELADRLKTAVRYQMVADVEVGAFLSGGVNSSSVVSMMAQIAPASVSTYSISVGAENLDETEFARNVAARYKTKHHLRNVDPQNLTQLLPRLPHIYDEPFGDDFGDPDLRRLSRSRAHAEGLPHRRRRRRNLAGYRRYRFHLAENAMRQYLPDGLRKVGAWRRSRALYPKLDWAPRPLRAKTTLLELSGDEDIAFARMVAMISQEQRTAPAQQGFRARPRRLRSERDHPRPLPRGAASFRRFSARNMPT